MFYPAMIDLENKNIVVIGAGNIAYRKTKKLLQYNAHVKVVGSSIYQGFYELKEKYKNYLDIVENEYNIKYILDAFMVIGATSSKNINCKICEDCKNNNILICNVDNIDDSDFIVPSSFKRGDLIISISTMGKSPSLSSKIKKSLEKEYGEEYDEYVDLLGKIREIVLKKYDDERVKKQILNNIVNLPFDEIRKMYRELL